jgi:integrase
LLLNGKDYPRLRRKGRAFYFDTLQYPRKWIPLGSDEASAIAEYERLLRAEKSPSNTVSRMMWDYIEYLAAGGVGPKKKPVTKSTLRMYRSWVKNVEEKFGEMDPTTLTQGDVSRYLYLCPRTTGPAEISVLNGAYQHQMRMNPNGPIKFDPCIGVKSIKPAAKRDRLLSDAEFLAVRKVACARLCIAMDLGYTLGLRPVDIFALERDQFIDTGMAVQHQKTKYKQLWEITDDIREILADARALSGNVVNLRREHSYVICHRDGKRYHERTVSRWWREACKKAGVEGTQFRDVRSKAGTDVEAAGGNAQTFLGHTNPRTTELYLRGKRFVKVTPNRRKIK